jgi:hypothetical protein
MGVWYHGFSSLPKKPKGKHYAWKFRSKNQNLRAVRASRTFSANEHSISRCESVFARPGDENEKWSEWKPAKSP